MDREDSISESEDPAMQEILSFASKRYH
jgi:hypothetical protein